MTKLPTLSSTHIWLSLMALTLCSWLLSAGPDVATGTIATAVIIGIAVIKARMVMRYFMEVKSAPLWLRRGTDVWAGVMFAALLFQHI
ncbi:MAG: cytochrome C oxidase subunit IV family protein [Spongiibacter sp.]|nr:cytochrome C oxidase subunit IV family protein [Spongiibacter sp.]